MDFNREGHTGVAQDARNAARTHGGNIYAAAKQYGIDEKKIIDFSSNVNPLGPSGAAVRAAKKALTHIDRYPDPDSRELRAAVARYFGIKSQHVACGNGSNALIHLIPRVFRPRKVLMLMPTFTEYAVAVENAGGEVVLFPLQEQEGFRVDPISLSLALQGVDMAFLCNPNNPTGALIPKSEMLEILQSAIRHEVRLVVDEAFMDFCEDNSIIKEAVQATRIICLRAFTKFFGMPGLRAGYAISDEKTISVLREAQESWSISIPAEQAAIAALKDWDYSKKTLRLIARERDRLIAALRIMPGVDMFPCSANFMLFKLTSYDAPRLMDKLGERGVLVRGCASFPGLDSRFIRIAVRTRRDNMRLIRALRDLLIR